MPQFLIDVNIPYYFKLWNNNNFVHQLNLNDMAPDTEIWEYALENNLAILTKDADFSKKILFQEPPPKVIHIKLGNMKMKEFHETISKAWPSIMELLKQHKLINVYADRIEAIK